MQNYFSVYSDQIKHLFVFVVPLLMFILCFVTVPAPTLPTLTWELQNFLVSYRQIIVDAKKFRRFYCTFGYKQYPTLKLTERGKLWQILCEPQYYVTFVPSFTSLFTWELIPAIREAKWKCIWFVSCLYHLSDIL